MLQLAYDELVIRYGIDFAFEIVIFVLWQKQTLPKYAKEMTTNGHRFREGEWYCGGQLMNPLISQKQRRAC
jgi:hypothetical protein